MALEIKQHLEVQLLSFCSIAARYVRHKRGGSLILAFCHTGITISNRRAGDAFPGFWKPLPSHPEGCGEWGTEWLLSNGILIWLERQ